MVNTITLNEIFLRELKKKIYVETKSSYKIWNFLFLIATIWAFVITHSFFSGFVVFVASAIALYDVRNYIEIHRTVGIQKLYEVDFNGEKIRIVANDKLEVVIILADQNKQIAMDDVKEIDYVIV